MEGMKVAVTKIKTKRTKAENKNNRTANHVNRNREGLHLRGCISFYKIARNNNYIQRHVEIFVLNCACEIITS